MIIRKSGDWSSSDHDEWVVLPTPGPHPRHVTPHLIGANSNEPADYHRAADYRFSFFFTIQQRTIRQQFTKFRHSAFRRDRMNADANKLQINKRNNRNNWNLCFCSAIWIPFGSIWIIICRSNRSANPTILSTHLSIWSFFKHRLF